MCGANLKEIQELLGHTSIKSTEIYAHVTNDYLKKAIENPLYNEMF
jgi:integrase/recombinase XerC